MPALSNAQDNQEDEEACRLHIAGITRHGHNMEELYWRSEDFDFLIRVKGAHFHVHSIILMARSPVFNAMMTHDFVERTSRVLVIEDIEILVFQAFLFFLYTGKLAEDIKDETVIDLYCAADKYDVPILKKICVNYLKRKLSVSIVCATICLAWMHNEQELLNLSSNFLRRHYYEIRETREWQQFRTEHPAISAELLMDPEL